MAGEQGSTRIRLLEAAVAVMAEGGWSATTSRAVAERAQVNNALVHYHFGSVDALRRAAVLHAVELELAGPVTAIVEKEDVLEGVADAVRGLIGRGPGTTGQRVLLEALIHGLRDDELRRESERQIRRFRELLASRLAESRRAGRLRADADPEALATVLAALMDGLLLHVLIDPRTDVGGSVAGLTALLRPSGGAPAGRPDERGATDDEDDEDEGDDDDTS